jgi:hypothetical protein
MQLFVFNRAPNGDHDDFLEGNTGVSGKPWETSQLTHRIVMTQPFHWCRAAPPYRIQQKLGLIPHSGLGIPRRVIFLLRSPGYRS